MFKPEFDHDRTKVFEAVGIPDEAMNSIRKFQLEYGMVMPRFQQVSVLLEYYWERLPKELIEEPFFTFYLGIFIARMLNREDSQTMIMN